MPLRDFLVLECWNKSGGCGLWRGKDKADLGWTRDV
jgi:hypothetical protein